VLVEVERLPRGQRRREPRVLWLWWHGPEGEAPDLGLLWRAYARRFDLEHTFRFLKQMLEWSTPGVRHPESRPTGGRGWSSPLSRNGVWRERARRIGGCPLGTPLRHRSPDTDPNHRVV
jgi:hypothetical protein